MVVGHDALFEEVRHSWARHPAKYRRGVYKRRSVVFENLADRGESFSLLVVAMLYTTT